MTHVCIIVIDIISKFIDALQREGMSVMGRANKEMVAFHCHCRVALDTEL